MLTKTTNPTPTVTESKVSGEDILRQVIVSAKAARTAALTLCYAAAAYILKVNHFTDAKSKDYMSKSDAIEYLQKEIKNQADVQGKMLDLYVRNASQLVGCLIGSQKMFSSTINQLATADTAEGMISALSSWMEKSYDRRIESMSALSEALGYKTGRPTPTVALTPTKAVERVQNTIKNIEKSIKDNGLKVKESDVAKAVASAVRSSLTLAREAIKRIVEEDDLKALEAAIKEQRSYLRELSHDAAVSVKKGAANNNKTPVKGKAKAPVQHSTVQ